MYVLIILIHNIVHIIYLDINHNVLFVIHIVTNLFKNILMNTKIYKFLIITKIIIQETIMIVITKQ